MPKRESKEEFDGKLFSKYYEYICDNSERIANLIIEEFEECNDYYRGCLLSLIIQCLELYPMHYRIEKTDEKEELKEDGPINLNQTIEEYLKNEYSGKMGEGFVTEKPYYCKLGETISIRLEQIFLNTMLGFVVDEINAKYNKKYTNRSFCSQMGQFTEWFTDYIFDTGELYKFSNAFTWAYLYDVQNMTLENVKKCFTKDPNLNVFIYNALDAIALNAEALGIKQPGMTFEKKTFFELEEMFVEYDPVKDAIILCEDESLDDIFKIWYEVALRMRLVKTMEAQYETPEKFCDNNGISGMYYIDLLNDAFAWTYIEMNALFGYEDDFEISLGKELGAAVVNDIDKIYKEESDAINKIICLAEERKLCKYYQKKSLSAVECPHLEIHI